MAALDFPNPPLTVGQTYTAPTGAIYTWDGAVWSSTTPVQNAYWTDTGTTLQPASSPRNVAVPAGNVATTVTAGGGDGLLVGAATVANKIHVGSFGTAAGGGALRWNMTCNPAAGGALDDSTLPAWSLQANLPAPDALNIYRAPATTGAPAFVNFASFTNTGHLKLPAVGDLLIELGTAPGKGTIDSNQSLQLDVNHPWSPDTTTSPSWALKLDMSLDQLAVYRRAANASAGNVTMPFSISADGVTHCTLAGSSVTPGMLAPGASTRSVASVGIPANWSSTSVGAWINMGNTPTINIPSGSTGFIFCFASFYIVGTQGTTYDWYFGFHRDGNMVTYSHVSTGTGGSLGATIPCNASFAWYDNTAGSHYWGPMVLWLGGGTLHTSDAPGNFIIWGMA